jgi:hypothetical protein
MSFDQIHFGAGRDGVGAILPLSIAAGARVHVVVHQGSLLDAGARLACSEHSENGGRPKTELDVVSFSRADTLRCLEEQARTTLEDAEELLLTTAITPRGIGEQREFLLSLVGLRADRRTIVIANEQEHGEEHEELRQRLGERGVEVRRGVVNRLCRRDMAVTEADRRAVRADEHVEWLIEGPADSPPLAALAQAPGVRFTDRIEEHALRTRWLVCGVRLALALLAQGERQPVLQVPGTESARKEWVDAVYAALVPLVRERCRELDDAVVREQAEAVRRFDDDVLCTLRHLKRAHLLPFMRELQRALGEPYRALVQSGEGLPFELHRVLFALEVVLSGMENYTDLGAYRRGNMVLSEGVDAKVVDAYGDLLAGILDLDEVRRRKLALEYQLDQHREELAEFGAP